MTRAAPRRLRRRAAVCLLLLAGILLPLLAAAAPASAATEARAAASAPAGTAVLTAAAAPAASGPCGVPVVGDLGSLLGLCPSGSGLTGAATASCQSAPAPTTPGTGLSGWLEVKPDPLPPPGRAFGADAASTEYDQYGYAGLDWNVYGGSCILGTPVSFGPMIDTMIGNLLLGAAKGYVALDNTVHDWAASPAWITSTDPLITAGTRALHDDIFAVWAGLALLVLALTVIARSFRGDAAGAVTRLAWALLVLALVGGVSDYPTLAGQAAQSLMSETLNALDAGLTGPGGQASAAQAHDSLITTNVLYEQWLYGELGRPDSHTAQTYGPELFADQALTWRQAAASPAALAKTEKADQAAWAKVAAQVQTADPSAYQTLQGNAGTRIGAGALALLLAVITCTFDLWASLMVILALLSVLLAAVVFPGVAVVGLNYDMRQWVIGLGSGVLRRLVRAVLYAAAAGIDGRATSLLLNNGAVPVQMAILLLAILPFGLWLLIRGLSGQPAVPRPFLAYAGLIGLRRLTRPAPGALATVPGGPADNRTVVVNYNFFGWPGGPPPGGAGGPGGGPLPPPPGGGGGGSGPGGGPYGGGPYGGGPPGGGSYGSGPYGAPDDEDTGPTYPDAIPLHPVGGGEFARPGDDGFAPWDGGPSPDAGSGT